MKGQLADEFSVSSTPNLSWSYTSVKYFNPGRRLSASCQLSPGLWSHECVAAVRSSGNGSVLIRDHPGERWHSSSHWSLTSGPGLWLAGCVLSGLWLAVAGLSIDLVPRCLRPPLSAVLASSHWLPFSELPSDNTTYAEKETVTQVTTDIPGDLSGDTREFTTLA